MKVAFVVLSLLIGVSALAGNPKFEKANNSSGYTVKELSKNHLKVELILPSETSAKFLKSYGMRAVGEECLARGFKFFDYGDDSTTSYIGFCHDSSSKKALAITFEDSGLKESPRRFKVENLNSKNPTKLLLGDEVVLMAKQKPVSMAQVKSLVFQATQKTDFVPLEIIRNGKKLKIDEPIVLVANGTLGTEELEAIRGEF